MSGRSPSDDSFRLTIKVRQLSEGFRDEQWISALAAPLLGDLLLRSGMADRMCPRWMLMQWWYAEIHLTLFQPLYLSPGNGRATFAASENRLGPDLAGLLPGTRTQGINRNVSLPPR